MSEMGIACGLYAKDRGVSVTHISKKTGIPVDKISRSFRGLRKMTADELMNVCDALGTQPASIRALIKRAS